MTDYVNYLTKYIFIHLRQNLGCFLNFGLHDVLLQFFLKMKKRRGSERERERKRQRGNV